MYKFVYSRRKTCTCTWQFPHKFIFILPINLYLINLHVNLHLQCSFILSMLKWLWNVSFLFGKYWVMPVTFLHFLSLNHTPQRAMEAAIAQAPIQICDILGAFIHKKDRDFHRAWNTEIFCACLDKRKYLADRRAGWFWSPNCACLISSIALMHLETLFIVQLYHSMHMLLLPRSFWYARLEWWDRKYQDYLLERSHIRCDANNRANSQIIALILK